MEINPIPLFSAPKRKLLQEFRLWFKYFEISHQLSLQETLHVTQKHQNSAASFVYGRNTLHSHPPNPNESVLYRRENKNDTKVYFNDHQNKFLNTIFKIVLLFLLISSCSHLHYKQITFTEHKLSYQIAYSIDAAAERKEGERGCVFCLSVEVYRRDSSFKFWLHLMR